MKNHNFLFIILLGITLSNCGDTKKGENSIFTIDNSAFKEQYQPQESLILAILNPNNKAVDSITYFVNDKKVATIKGVEKLNFDLKEQKLGYQNLKAKVYYDNEFSEATARVELVSNVQPKLLKYKIVNTYPHDYEAYTQGLEFYRDTLYEGTGNGSGPTGKRGVSSLRKTDYKTGKVYKKVELADQYFGEGITILNNKVYQLTWQNNEGYIYNADTFKKEKTFPYFKQIEGWGLTNDGTYLYQSDGTEKIWKLDPKTLKEVDYINVYSYETKIKAVNELEWINGKIYGNIYQKDAIAIIDPKSGIVEAIINLVDLKSKVSHLPDTDVLNGIAYNPKTKTIFVTGKNWDKMFEISVSE
ncbi:glutaminyl-peptide cyclotransferase [Flavobacterium sp. P4023]|uniref:Glutaminyl-peptide cyclotransferase n=1 Tax=Flavobacterium flabelliforme TaxID=2816119 RepID=A0ABS5CUR0_9FLAO|nr:glutaminyl-peptide cyclotransferase [Flavobacterium flabelliforme]MBP4142360.1 glutaminyl-peptide cyclotransferase [Flavobacterium flabelliforme]